VVVVSAHHIPVLRVVRDHQERNARTVTEIVERLDVTGIPVAATFVEGYEQRRVLSIFYSISGVLEYS